MNVGWRPLNTTIKYIHIIFYLKTFKLYLIQVESPVATKNTVVVTIIVSVIQGS